MASHPQSQNDPNEVPVEIVGTARPQQPYPPQYAAPRRRRSFLSLMVVLMGVFAVGAFFIGALVLLGGGLTASADSRIEEKHFSYNRLATSKIAIISVEGVILDEDDGFIKRQIDYVAKDENVKAVVLRVNSPGGSVSGSDYLFHHLKRLRDETRTDKGQYVPRDRPLPVVVSMGGTAASGGYYVSMAVGDQPDSIFAEPTTITGSIGVIIPHYEVSGLMQEYGVKQDSIASHRLKGMGSIARPMTDEERKIFQNLVDEMFGRFKEVVRSGRPRFEQHPDELDKLATGQVYMADTAVENGLVDRIGFLEDAVDRARELAGLAPDDVQVVKYKKPFSFSEAFLGVQSQKQPFDANSLVELATPRAYYLYSWLPPLTASGR